MIDSGLHERLLRKIRTREQFEIELRRAFDGEPGLDSSLARLKEQGILDDRRAAEALVRAKNPASRGYLESLLSEKGVDPKQVLQDHDDLAAARQIAMKRVGDPVPRLARYLASKGFEEDTIEIVLSERQAP